mmetsp:Transcript_28694/g.51101  ORF Transcript_28694/g.51101 Transcript_28694/m.51101 type:complete len:435 (-) Transcript_28694:71-1375(-)
MARAGSRILVGRPWMVEIFADVHNGVDIFASSSPASKPSSDWQVPLIVGACCFVVIVAAVLVSCYCWRRSREHPGRRDVARAPLISPSPVENAAPLRSSEPDLFRTPRATDMTCGDTFATPTSASWPRPSQGAESRLSLARATRPSLWASAEEIKANSVASQLSTTEADMSRVKAQIRMQLEEALQSGLLARVVCVQQAHGEAQHLAQVRMSSSSRASELTADQSSEQESAQPEPEPSDRPSTASSSTARSSTAASEASSARLSSAAPSTRSPYASLLPPTLEEQAEGPELLSPRPSCPLPPPLEEFAASFSGDSTGHEQHVERQDGEPLLSDVEEAWLKQVFMHCDIRCNGAISFVELSASLIQRPDIAVRFGMNLRPDARGRRQSATQDLEDFFGRIDTDRTREISWSELYAFYTRHRSGRTSDADNAPCEP